MKLSISVNTASGAQFFGEAGSVVEFEEIRKYLATNGILAAGATAAPTTKAPPAEGNKKPEAEKPKADKPKADAPKKDAQAAAPAKTAVGPTIEEVTAVLTEVADKFSVPEALLLNKRFGVKKAGELKPEQYADYIAFAKDCIANDRAPSAAVEESADDDVSGLV